MMKSRGGFTLVEILIVVVILGILAAIVVPQFTEASGEAKDSRLLSDMQSVRSQIELYKIQHTGVMPGLASNGSAPATFDVAMTGYTLGDGTAAAIQAPAVGVLGPYMQRLPSNPYATSNPQAVNIVQAAPLVADLTAGWFFNNVTGEFGASTSFTDSAGNTDLHYEW
jgi:general secretion pathway protein G